jgi:hypothetical protein
MEANLDSSVYPLNPDVEKDNITQDDSSHGNHEDLKAMVDEYLLELISDQQESEKRLEKLERDFFNEVVQVRNIFKGLGEEFDKFKDNVRKYIDDTIPPEIESLKASQDETLKRINSFEQSLSALKFQKPENSESANEAANDLREELIVGIRMIGKRVTKAVKEMDSRFKEFSEHLEAELQQTKKVDHQIETEFGGIKESVLVNYEQGYDIVPKNAVDKLSTLFKKQSLNINKIVEIQQEKIKGFEELLRSYDEESSKLIKRLTIKAQRNFYLAIISFSALLILIVLFKYII